MPVDTKALYADFERRYALRPVVRRIHVDLDKALKRERADNAILAGRMAGAEARRNKGIAVVDEMGVTFPTVIAAAKAEGVTRRSITLAIRQGTKCHGRKWFIAKDAA